MTKVYIVTSGDYSDYHILGCFSTEKAAKRVKEQFSADNIEEYELDEIGKDNRFIYRVYINPKESYANIMINFTGEQNKVHYYQHRVGLLHEDRSEITYWVEIMAEDKEHAIKIASDLVAQYKVEHNL